MLNHETDILIKKVLYINKLRENIKKFINKLKNTIQIMILLMS